MSQTQDESKVRNDPAFEVSVLNPSDEPIIVEITIPAGGIALTVQKGIMGALSNQLKSTDNRKGSSILRKLGHVLSDCGNVLYGADINETDLDPNLIVSETIEEEKE